MMKLTRALSICMLPALVAGFVPPAAKTVRGVPSTAPAIKHSPFASGSSTLSLSKPFAFGKSSTRRMNASVAGEGEDGNKGLGQKLFDVYQKTASVATTLFPLWTVLFTLIALKSPESFAWFTTEYFTAAIAALMLSMGITLKPKDFADVAAHPVPTFIQFALCYGMMPVLAFFIGKGFGLEKAIIAGMVLVGSTNGGQASNLCTYIAKGNVALSVLMTTATTLGAIVMTPFLCKSLLGAVVPVDAKGIAKSTIEVVLVPIIVGMSTNQFFPKFVKAILPFAPVVGVVSTCLLVGSSVAQVAGPILSAGWSLQIALLLYHLIGGLVGYNLPKTVGFGETSCRTMAIETAMKSSAFSFLLAKLHFGQYAARVPAAVSVVWMALTGSLLAVFWRYQPVAPDDKDEFSLKKIFRVFQKKAKTVEDDFEI